MNFDIAPLLEGWEYKPGQICVRRFKAKDGSEKLQLRVDLGILQMNAEGRPDGKKPYGHESLLEHYEARLAKHLAAHEGQPEGFELSSEDCSRLLQEAIQFHHRYICLFQIQDYEAVLRDTARNLKVFEFVDEFAVSEEVSWSLQQFRPQLLMMETRARGMIAINNGSTAGAIKAIEQGLDAIRQFFQDFGRTELGDQSGEIQSLETWLKELQEKARKRPSRRGMSAREKLEHALNEAVLREDYELAAKYRDSLRKLAASQNK